MIHKLTLALVCKIVSSQMTLIVLGPSYLEVCKDGPKTDGLISLSNSVNSADAPRLEKLSSTLTMSKEKHAQLLHGRLLLCKVFVGHKVEAREDQLSLVLVYYYVYCVFWHVSHWCI